jgi:hypothetical protein
MMMMMIIIRIRACLVNLGCRCPLWDAELWLLDFRLTPQTLEKKLNPKKSDEDVDKPV